MLSREIITKKLGDILTYIENTPFFKKTVGELEQLRKALDALKQKKDSAKTALKQMLLSNEGIDAKTLAAEKAVEKKSGELNALDTVFHYNALASLRDTLSNEANSNLNEIFDDLQLIEEHTINIGKTKEVTNPHIKNLTLQVERHIEAILKSVQNANRNAAAAMQHHSASSSSSSFSLSRSQSLTPDEMSFSQDASSAFRLGSRPTDESAFSNILTKLIDYLAINSGRISTLITQYEADIQKLSPKSQAEATINIVAQMQADHSFTVSLLSTLKKLQSQLKEDSYEQINDIGKFLKLFMKSKSGDDKKEYADRINSVLSQIEASIEYKSVRERNSRFDTTPVTPDTSKTWPIHILPNPGNKHSGKLLRPGTLMPTAPKTPPMSSSAVAAQPTATTDNLDPFADLLDSASSTGQSEDLVSLFSSPSAFDFITPSDSIIPPEQASSLSSFFSGAQASQPQTATLTSSNDESQALDLLTAPTIQPAGMATIPFSHQAAAMPFITSSQTTAASHLEETKEQAAFVSLAARPQTTLQTAAFNTGSLPNIHSLSLQPTSDMAASLEETKIAPGIAAQAQTNPTPLPSRSEAALLNLKNKLALFQQGAQARIDSLRRENVELLAKNNENADKVAKLKEEEADIRKSRFTSKKRREHIPALILATELDSAENVRKMKPNQNRINSLQVDVERFDKIENKLDELSCRLDQYKMEPGFDDAVFAEGLDKIEIEMNVFNNKKASNDDRTIAEENIVRHVNNMTFLHAPSKIRAAMLAQQEKESAEDYDNEENVTQQLMDEIEIIQRMLNDAVFKSNGILIKYEIALGAKGRGYNNKPTKNPDEIARLQKIYDRIMKENKNPVRAKLVALNKEMKFDYHFALKKDALVESIYTNLNVIFKHVATYANHRKMRAFAHQALKKLPKEVVNGVKDKQYHNKIVDWAQDTRANADKIAEAINAKNQLLQPNIKTLKPVSFWQKLWRNKFTILLTMLGLAGGAALCFFTLGLGTIALPPFIAAVAGCGISGGFIANLIGRGFDALLKPADEFLTEADIQKAEEARLAKEAEKAIEKPEADHFGKKLWRNKFTILLTLLGIAGGGAYAFFTFGLGSLLMPLVPALGGLIASFVGSGADSLLMPADKIASPPVESDELEIEEDEDEDEDEEYTDSESDEYSDVEPDDGPTNRAQKDSAVQQSKPGARAHVDARVSQNRNALHHHPKSQLTPGQQNKPTQEYKREPLRRG
jgi:hypothetical protein